MYNILKEIPPVDYGWGITHVSVVIKTMTITIKAQDSNYYSQAY